MVSCTLHRPHRLVFPADRCDRELVLSLDGGGMRGYSSLLIIEALMAQVAEAESNHAMSLDDDTITSLLGDEKEPLPAHYFDYAVGTSTGGLIAIMLGRLRMQITDCLKEYERFGNDVFGRRRLWRWSQYDHRTLERVVKGVIGKYSKEDGDCALFTQPDTPRRACRTAVMAVRRNPATGDEAYIFRSYPFLGALLEDKPLDARRPLNPEGNGLAYIWQAARATSAAPHFFNDIDINGNRFMDGAVKINNPSFKAWAEACAMHHGREQSSPPTDRKKPPVGVFVSIGTGMAAPLTMFGGRNIVRHVARIGKAAIKRLSDPEDTHNFMESMFSENSVRYFRFNVQVGLENIKMDDSSSDTILKINNATKAYLAQPKVKKELRECAELLVAHRRGRNPTAEERRLREMHHCFFYESEDGCDTDACSCSTDPRDKRTNTNTNSHLTTPTRSGQRSRSNSNCSSGSRPQPPRLVIPSNGHLDPSCAGRRARHGSSASSSPCMLLEREQDCPATERERELLQGLLNMPSESQSRPRSRSPARNGVEPAVMRSCSP